MTRLKDCTRFLHPCMDLPTQWLIRFHDKCKTPFTRQVFWFVNHSNNRAFPSSVSDRKPLIFPISALGSNFNPQNTSCIPLVKILARLELEKIFRLSPRHCYRKTVA